MTSIITRSCSHAGFGHEQQKRGGPKTIPPATFTAIVDAELKGLRVGGNLHLDPPWVDFGRTKPAGERAFRPWPGCLPEDKDAGGAETANIFLRVQLRKNVQVFPWVRIDAGEIFVTTWPVIATLGFDLERFGGLAPLWILNKQQ